MPKTRLTVQDAVHFAAKLFLKREEEWLQGKIDWPSRSLSNSHEQDSNLLQIKKDELAEVKKMLKVLEHTERIADDMSTHPSLKRQENELPFDKRLVNKPLPISGQEVKKSES